MVFIHFWFSPPTEITTQTDPKTFKQKVVHCRIENLRTLITPCAAPVHMDMYTRIEEHIYVEESVRVVTEPGPDSRDVQFFSSRLDSSPVQFL